ncbi:MAG TPA: hypothetical protein VE990_15680 [Acidimicrobiales bacterium]|nr:hypothetical protein [Acidimicrobiales bacterium]
MRTKLGLLAVVVVGTVLAALAPPGVAGATGAATARWSAPVHLSDYSQGELIALSCGGGTCVAETGRGTQVNTGSGWSEAQNGPGGESAVACASSTFCLVPSGYWYDGATWHPGSPIPVPGGYQTPGTHSDFPVSLSCASRALCVAGDNHGNVYQYSNGGWTGPIGLAPYSQSINGVSCPTTSFCLAITEAAETFLFNGQGWSPGPNQPAGTSTTQQVSCPTATSCTAVDNQGDVYTWTPSGWSGAVRVESAFAGTISCPTVSACVMVDYEGRAFTGSGTTWSGPVTVDSNSTSDSSLLLARVSCGTPSSCVVLDGNVNAVAGQLSCPTAAMVHTTDGGGYWTADACGVVHSLGDAQAHGDLSGSTLARPIVGMAATPDAGGYWMVASDGGIFTFGDAHFFGSTGNIHLAQPVVGMAATPDGGGYWMVASDGGIFTFGDAHFFGAGWETITARPIGRRPTLRNSFPTAGARGDGAAVIEEACDGRGHDRRAQERAQELPGLPIRPPGGRGGHLHPEPARRGLGGGVATGVLPRLRVRRPVPPGHRHSVGGHQGADQALGP